jgi:hypothetical protein
MMMLGIKELEAAFTRLGELAIDEGHIVELAVYGGSALAIAYDLRSTTRDVDAVFEKDREFVQKAVAKVALEMDLPLDWLNDAVKGYVSPNEAGNMIKFGSFPSEANPGLRILVPAPEYFFAMKCIDIRTGATSNDVEDVQKLALVCGIRNAQHAMDIVQSFYTDRPIPPKTGIVLQEIFENLNVDAAPQIGRAGFPDALAEFEKNKRDSAARKGPK